jgi:hypothetical protein
VLFLVAFFVVQLIARQYSLLGQKLVASAVFVIIILGFCMGTRFIVSSGQEAVEAVHPIEQDGEAGKAGGEEGKAGGEAGGEEGKGVTSPMHPQPDARREETDVPPAPKFEKPAPPPQSPYDHKKMRKAYTAFLKKVFDRRIYPILERPNEDGSEGYTNESSSAFGSVSMASWASNGSEAPITDEQPLYEPMDPTASRQAPALEYSPPRDPPAPPSGESVPPTAPAPPAQAGPEPVQDAASAPVGVVTPRRVVKESGTVRVGELRASLLRLSGTVSWALVVQLFLQIVFGALYGSTPGLTLLGQICGMITTYISLFVNVLILAYFDGSVRKELHEATRSLLTGNMCVSPFRTWDLDFRSFDALKD